MISIHTISGNIYQQIPDDETITTYKDLLPLVKTPKPDEYDGIDAIVKKILLDDKNNILDLTKEINYENILSIVFQFNYIMKISTHCNRHITVIPDFVTHLIVESTNNSLIMPLELPSSLQVLYLGDNIKTLPKKWNDTLQEIYLSYSQNYLPDKWPSELKLVHLGCNITKLPDEWSQSLETIILASNQSHLPKYWPPSLKILYLGQNSRPLPQIWPSTLANINFEDNDQAFSLDFPSSVKHLTIFRDNSHLAILKKMDSFEELNEINKTYVSFRRI